jgi:parvulin-like peptidyl-prolyl isomerase
MRRIYASILCLCLMATTYTEALGQSKTTKPLPGSTVIAIVDQRSITMDDLNQQMNRPDIKAAADALKDKPAEMEQLRKTVFASMIDKELLIKAATASASYQPDTIKKEVDTIIEEQGGQPVIQPILSSYGTSWDAFMKDMNERVTIEKFIEKDLLAKVTISDNDLQSEFSKDPSQYAEPETVTARHILVLVKPNASTTEQQEALERISQIRSRVTASGADFGKIAAETSDDTASKVDGGNLGAFQRGMMVPEFEKAAFALQIGEISDPIKTDYGYHIIKVEKHQQSEPPSFEKAKGKVRYQLMASIHDKVITEKLTQLRSAAKIEYKVAEFKQS